MSAVGGVAGVGRTWWDGGWEGWLGSQIASLGLPVPSSPPPETPSSGHTSVLAILCTGLAPLASRPFHILFPRSAVPFPQTSLLSFGLSSSAPPHPQDALSTCRERWPLPCAAPSQHTYHLLATPRLSILPAPVVCFCCGQMQENLGVGAEQLWESLGCWEES